MYIIKMADLFSRFGIATPMPDQTLQTLIDILLSRWILPLGAQRGILSDQGANLELAQVQNLRVHCRIEKVPTTPYQKSGKGACERLNQIIKPGLQHVLHGQHLKESDVPLSEVMFSSNTSVDTSTGYTPQILMFGQEARVPVEVISWIPPLEQKPSAYSWHSLAYDAAREAKSCALRRAKDYNDAGAHH